MARPRILDVDIAIAAVLTAMEDDQSRDAVWDPKAQAQSGAYVYRPPSAFTLRRGMQSLRVTDFLTGWLFDVAACAYAHETWYCIDCTYLRSRYYRKIARVWDNEAKQYVYKRIKNCKLYLARGLRTGIIVAWTICDDYTSDQTQFRRLLEMILHGDGSLRGGGSIQGGGICADAGFNDREFYGLVSAAGGRGFLDFDANARHSRGVYPEYDRIFELWKNRRDEWFEHFNKRPAIEETNHSLKVIKDVVRAQKPTSRENEVKALLLAFSLTRVQACMASSEFKGVFRLPAFADAAAEEFMRAAIMPQRMTKIDQAVREERRLGLPPQDYAELVPGYVRRHSGLIVPSAISSDDDNSMEWT